METKKYRIKPLDHLMPGMLTPEQMQVQLWTLDEILQEINRDHSEDFTPYNESDWREGWKEWVEGEYYTLLD